MDITVIVCTYNRAQSLADSLEKLAASVLPESISWEVLVVDNNSTDATRIVAEQFMQRFPGRFRYRFEPQPGKSYALNSAVRESEGKVLAFVDDDVLVEPEWLRNLTADLLNGTWAGVGGRTLPADAVSLPPWLALRGPYALGGILAAIFDFGDQPCQLRRAPFGANMAYRREMFERLGGFRTDLGPSPDRTIPRPNEDTEFGNRVMAAGERLGYEPSAIACHPVAKDRLHQQYFLSWWFDYGRASIREGGRKPNVFGIPRHWISIPRMTVMLLAPTTLQWLLAVDPQKKFYRKCWIWTTFGQMVEMRRMYGGLART